MRLGAMRLTRAGLILPMMALTLLLSACGAATGSGSRAQSAAPKRATATAAIPTLNWRKISTPIDLTHGGVSMGVSPINGRYAWICEGNSAGHILIWRTQDAGATWRQVSSLSVATPAPTVLSTACNVIPDQNLSTSVAIWLPTDNPSAVPGSPSSAVAYYSSDGGISWTQMPQNWWIDQVATSGDTTYALVNDLAHQSNINIFASSDHFATWRSINPTAQEVAQNPPVLWVAPTTGDALLVTHYFNQLYHSTDGGNHWTLMAAPSGQSPEAQLAVWREQNAGWLMCGGMPSGSDTRMWCSGNLGKTWSKQPADTNSSCRPVGLTNDGSLYDVCLAAGAYGSPDPYVVMRLSPGASGWTALGRAADKYITVTQSGQVWCNIGDGSATYFLDQLP